MGASMTSHMFVLSSHLVHDVSIPSHNISMTLCRNVGNCRHYPRKSPSFLITNFTLCDHFRSFTLQFRHLHCNNVNFPHRISMCATTRHCLCQTQYNRDILQNTFVIYSCLFAYLMMNCFRIFQVRRILELSIVQKYVRWLIMVNTVHPLLTFRHSNPSANVRFKLQTTTRWNR